MILRIIPDFFHIHGGRFLNPVSSIGNGDISRLIFLVDAEIVDGKAVGNGRICVGILHNGGAVGVQPVFVQGQLDDAVGQFILHSLGGARSICGRCDFLYVVRLGGTEAPNMERSVLTDGKCIGGVAVSVCLIGLAAGPQSAFRTLCAAGVIIESKACALQQLLGQNVFLLQIQREARRQIEVDGAVAHG